VALKAAFELDFLSQTMMRSISAKMSDARIAQADNSLSHRACVQCGQHIIGFEIPSVAELL